MLVYVALTFSLTSATFGLVNYLHHRRCSHGA